MDFNRFAMKRCARTLQASARKVRNAGLLYETEKPGTEVPGFSEVPTGTKRGNTIAKPAMQNQGRPKGDASQDAGAEIKPRPSNHASGGGKFRGRRKE